METAGTIVQQNGFDRPLSLEMKVFIDVNRDFVTFPALSTMLDALGRIIKLQNEIYQQKL